MAQHFISKTLKKKVKSFGNSGHVCIPKQYIGCDVEMKIIKKLFVCERCSESFDVRDKSIDPNYCQECFAAKQFLKENPNLKCNACKKPMTPEEFKIAWDKPICENCLEVEN